MSAAVPSLSASAQAVMAVLSQLGWEEKGIIASLLREELREEFSQWEMDIANERICLLDEGLSIPVPREEAMARLDAKWGRSRD